MTGKWTFNKYLKVNYSWSNAPSGMKSTVPIDSNKYKSGDLVSVDGTYSNKTGYRKIEDFADTWTKTSISDGYWSGACYGNGIFVFGRHNSSQMFYNTDGHTNTYFNAPTNIQLRSIAYGNNTFVAVGGHSEYCLTSSNGINWTKHNMPISTYWSRVIYSNNKFVAIQTSSDNSFGAYSDDNGNSWVNFSINTTSNNAWGGICYGNGKYVITHNGGSGTATNDCIWSSDLITWNTVTISSTASAWCDCYYADGIFLISTHSFKKGIYAYSYDGINWTEAQFTSTKRSWYIKGNFGGLWLIYCTDDMSYRHGYSYNGLSWTESSTTGIKLGATAYGNGIIASAIYDSTEYYYATFVSIVYQFSGWNKSNFNITSDTAIDGSWSTVSSSSGLTLVE